MNKFVKIFLYTCLTIFILVIVGLLFPYQYLQPEYQFVEDINNIDSKIVKVKKDSLLLKYKIYYNGKIDLEFEIFTNGIIICKTDNWFVNQSAKQRQYATTINNKEELNDFIKSIQNLQTNSEVSEVDDHFSGIYYTLELHRQNTITNSFDKTIEYYNVTPSKEFNDFRETLIQLLENRTWRKFTYG